MGVSKGKNKPESGGRQESPGMKRMWELAFTKKALVLSACALSVISVAVSFVPFIAIYYIIRELALHMGDVGGMNSGYIIRMGWLAGGAAVAAILLNFCALMCSHLAAFKTLYGLKLKFANHLASLPLGFHTENSTGKVRKIVDENIEKIEGFIAHQLPDIVGTMATPVIALVILFVFDWRMGAATLVPIVGLFALQGMNVGKEESLRFIRRYQDSLEDMNNAAVEYVRGISVVKAFGQTLYSFRKFYDSIRTYGDFVLAYTQSFQNTFVAFMVLVNHLYLALVPVIVLVAGGTEDYPKFAMSALFYLIFSVALTSPFLKLMYVSQQGRQIADGIERMDKVLAEKPLPEAKRPQTAKHFDIAFEDVHFAYGEEEALAGIGFTAKQHQITALVGPSGSGKSTIAHLIPRFYDIQSGAIKLDGVDIRKIKVDSLRGHIGIVQQDVFLFAGAVYENIRYGRVTATREEIMEAARLAEIHEDIMEMPDGYDTMVGERGMLLSGGQKQRISIARIFLKNPRILILDEATSALDTGTELRIQRGLDRLAEGRTTLVIAHRLSTIKHADEIIVVGEKGIVERGTHEQLLAKNGVYAELHSVQFAWAGA